MATLIIKNGEVVENVLPRNTEKGFSLSEVYRLLDCRTVEVVWLRGRIMLLDENGKCVPEPVVNEKATQIAHDDLAIKFNDYIVGNVLICSYDEFQ